MTRIMIAGAGHAGLGVATGLARARADIAIDLFTIHTTEELLRAPRLTQMTFPTVYQLEQAAGLDFWSGVSPVFRSIGFSVAPGDGTVQSFTGHQQGVGTAVDHGAKTAAWLQKVEQDEEFNPHGARIRVQTVQRQDLAWFATSGMYDLVIVATGDSDTHLAPLFEEVPTPSTTRVIVQAHFEGAPPGPDVQVTTTPFGEIFAYPVLAAYWKPLERGQSEGPPPDLFPATAVQVYARTDSSMDPTAWVNPATGTKDISFSPRPEVRHRAWAHAQSTLASYAPDLARWCADADLVEPSLLMRTITPRVRKPVAYIGANRTPILGIGDAVLTVDPTSGQGANASTRIASVITDKILQRVGAGLPLADADFLTNAYQTYWDQHGRHTSVFNDLVTGFWSGTLPEHMTQRFGGNFTDQAQADRMVVGWDDPSTLGWLLNP